MAFDRAIGAIVVYCEASSLSHRARLAVAWVLQNRVTDGRWGTSIAECALQRMQFSEWNDDRRNNENLLRAARAKDDDPLMVECVGLIDEVMQGDCQDPTDGATHFHGSDVQLPEWTDGAQLMVEIEGLMFYKGVR